MSKKSRKAQRLRRKRRYARSQLDRMNQALGEFMTELGRIEFRMLLYMGLINEAPLEAMFECYSEETFGGKIKVFKKWCEHGGVPERHKVQYEKVCQDLNAILDTRNMLVHAETWEGAFQGKPYQPYRVAIVEGNLDYLDDLEHVEHGDNVFDIDRVREATKLCIRLHTTLKAMRDELIADAEPYVPEPEESAWPTSSAA
jgi:hypothetical protein